MIGKVPGTGSGFHGLISYLMKGKTHEPNPDRVAWTSSQNLLVDDPALAPRLMRAVAKQSRRCQKPVYHLVISWSREENPTDDLMRTVGATTIADLQLHEHQAILIAHNDTEHKHLHMVVNRVHPVTAKAWHASNDYARIEISLRKQAEAMGLAYVPGKFNDPEAFGHTQRRAKDGEYQSAVRHGKPLPMEKFSAEEIKSRRLQLAPMFGGAGSWDELTQHLRATGLSLQSKGQGLVITDGLGFMKLSDLGKQVRLPALEHAYGEGFAAYAARERLQPQQTYRTDVVPTEYAPLLAEPAASAPIVPARPKRSVGPPDESEDEDKPEALSDAEKELLREEARRARIEARELELAARKRAHAAAASGSDDTIRGRDFVAADADHDHPHTSVEPRMADDPRSLAQAGLSGAFESFEMAQQLFKMGLLDRQGIEKASAELAYAKEQFGKHQTTQEWLQDGLRETFKPDTGTSKELTALQKREQELEIQIKREKEQRDRDR